MYVIVIYNSICQSQWNLAGKSIPCASTRTLNLTQIGKGDWYRSPPPKLENFLKLRFWAVYQRFFCPTRSTPYTDKPEIWRESMYQFSGMHAAVQLVMLTVGDAYVSRSTFRQSRPNKVGLKCPSVSTYVRTSIRPQIVSSISMKFRM